MNAYWQKTWKMWTVAILCAVVAITSVVGLSITLASADTQPTDTTRAFLISYAGTSKTVSFNTDKEIGGAIAQVSGAASFLGGSAEQPVLIKLLSDMDLNVGETPHVNFNFGDNTHVYFDLNGHKFIWEYSFPFNGSYYTSNSDKTYGMNLFAVGEDSTLTIADSSAERQGQFCLKDYRTEYSMYQDHAFVIGDNSTMNIDCNFGLTYFPEIILGENAVLNINSGNGLFDGKKPSSKDNGWDDTRKYYFGDFGFDGNGSVHGLSVKGKATSQINFRTTNSYLYVEGGNLNVYAAKDQTDASAYIYALNPNAVNINGGAFQSCLVNCDAITVSGDYTNETGTVSVCDDSGYNRTTKDCNFISGDADTTYNADDVKIPGVPSTQPDTGDNGDNGNTGDNNNDNNNTGDNNQNQQPAQEDNNTQFNSTPVVATCSAVAGGGVVGAGCAVGILIMRRRRQ